MVAELDLDAEYKLTQVSFKSHAIMTVEYSDYFPICSM